MYLFHGFHDILDADYLYFAHNGDDNMELPRRKPNRLKEYDYSSDGAYFVTICVSDSNALLWNNVGANCVRPEELPPLSDIGIIVDDEFEKFFKSFLE